jgi:hypothetical protein
MPIKGNKASALKENLWLGFLLFAHTIVAQPDSDENVLHDAVEHAIHMLPASQLGLYNGADYTPTTITAGGHPFFSTEESTPETIVYDDIPYTEIDLIFDASQQLVIIADYAGNKICPTEEKIESFTVENHTFKRLSNIPGLPSGFYDVLVDGNESLFARRSKYVRGLQWKSSTAYYFFNEGRLFRLTNKKTVFESMPDKAKDIRQFIRLNKLSFRNKIEGSLIGVVRHYSSLKQ